MGGRKLHVVIFAVLLLGVGGFFLLSRNSSKNLNSFAQCLKDRGAVFYGAFWCPHCQNQKKLFGSSEKYLPYIECSTPDGKEQIQTCKDKKVEGYPTWEFSDGSRLTGEVSLQELSSKTTCQLP